MKEDIFKLAEIIKSRTNHFLIIHGNVYDNIPLGKTEFRDVVDLLINVESSSIAFPWCLVYDIFSGLKIERGKYTDITSLMGFPPPEKDKKSAGSELMKALKESKGESLEDLPKEPNIIFPGLNSLLNKSTVPTLLIINFAEGLIPAKDTTNSTFNERALSIGLVKWAKDDSIRKAGHVIVLISRQSVSLEGTILDRIFEGAQIRVSKPQEEERKAFFEIKHPESAISLSKATAGLSLKDLKKILLQTASTSKDDILNTIFQFKQMILRDEYSDLMEVMAPKFGFDAIGGLEHLVKEFTFISKSMREGNYALVPQGILMMGPPGTGKTIFAEATAKDAGVNFIKPTDLKSMWLGESERRATKFYDALKDLAPVVVWIDEIDQYQKQRGGFDGDSGVSSNLFKKMLEFMSNPQNRGRILFMFATNRPDLLDSAMKRDGRCDLRLAFLPPDEEQLALICQAAFKQYPEMKTEIKSWRNYTKGCNGFNGANIIEVVRRAWTHTIRCGRTTIKDEDMKWALKDYVIQRADIKDIAEMALASILNCSSTSLLPDNWEELKNGYEKILGNERKYR